MARGKKVYLPPRFMTIKQCIEQLLEVEEKHDRGVCRPDAMAVGVARLGQPDQQIVAGTLAELKEVDFGGPLHSLVLVGEMHILEQEMLEHFKPKAAASKGKAEASEGKEEQ